MNNRAGFLFLFIVLMFSISNGIDTFGTIVEQVFGFISQVLTFLLVIALYGKWQGKSLFSNKLTRLIAYSYPLFLVVIPVYQYFEYAEQTMPRSYVYMQTLEFLLAVYISSVLTKEKK